MPPYVGNPTAPVAMLLAGVPAYAFGSKGVGPTVLMQVTKVAITSNVATLNVTMREGNIPSVGDLVTVRGTSLASGAFNVTNVALSGVSIDPISGAGTITFALTHADVSTTPDAGQAYAPPSDVPEALANGTSAAFALQEDQGMNQNGRTITWTLSFPVEPSAAVFSLEGALDDNDADYGVLDTYTWASGTNPALRYVTLVNVRFLRVVVASVSGTSPTVLAKILV